MQSLEEMRAALQSADTRPTSGGSQAVTFTPEQAERWRGVIDIYASKIEERVPVPESLIPMPEGGEDKRTPANKSSDLGVALRRLFCPAGGANEGDLVWISTYAEYTGKGDDKEYTGQLTAAVRRTIPASAKVVVDGVFAPDGTRLK